MEKINSEIPSRESVNTIKKSLTTAASKMKVPTKDMITNAERIGYQNYPQKLIKTDQYGFIKQPKQSNHIPNTSSIVLTLEEIDEINKSTEEWTTILDEYSLYKTTKLSILKEKTRQGIPDSLRGIFWKKFLNIENYIKDKTLYNNLLLDNENYDEESEEVILKDLNRSFPSNSHFSELYGSGQRALYHVLSAYSKYNLDVGYVQGMAFITGTLLLYMDEESAFYSLDCLMKNFGLEGVYKSGFPCLKKNFYVLLRLMKKLMPSIFYMFKKNEISPTIYASGWFFTIFTRDLNFNVTVRILDCLFLEGPKIIYRMALALLKLKENELKDCQDSGDILLTLKTIHDDLNIDNLFDVAFKFKIQRCKIKQFEEDYEKVKNSENDEIINIL